MRGQRRLAEEQSALRRVATLVAANTPPEQVFQTVTAEVCRLLDLRTAVLHRFEDAETSTIVGKFGEPTGTFDLGNTIRLEEGAAIRVRRTGTAARANLDLLTGPGATGFAPSAFGRRSGSRSPSPAQPGARWSQRFGRARRSRSRPSTGWPSSPSSRRSQSQAHTPAPSSPPHACGSSRRATPNGGGSSEISTTARSSGSWPCRSGCASPRRRPAPSPARQSACSARR